MNLKRRVASGFKWSSVSQIGRQGTQLVTTVILARLLSPSDFGLVGMAMVAVGFISLFKDLGTASAIIRLKKLSEELLSSIFWVNVAFGLFAMIGLFIVSPLVAGFYQESRVISLLRLLSLSISISSLSVVQQAILERDITFNKLAILELIATLCGSFVGIISALLGYGVWSLVYQVLAMTMVTTVLLWFVVPWRPKFIFKWAEVRVISNYSLNLVGFNIFNYFARNADNLLIGRFLGAQSLGYYNLAYRIMLYPLQNISAVITRVTYPAYSQFQDDNIRFQRAYLNVIRTIALITFPIMIGILVTSRPFVLTFFGSQWAPAITLLIILAPVGLVQSIGTTVGAIYQAKGYTGWMLYWGIGSGLLIFLAFIIGLQWGVVGVAAAYAIVSIILTYPGFAIPFKLIDLPVFNLGYVLWQPLLGSSLMAITLLIIRAILPDHFSNGLTFGILVLVGAITYSSISWTINRDHIRQVLGTV